MRYSDTLAQRLKEKRLAKAAALVATQGDGVTIADVHPGRYPVHKDPAKGQAYGGVCNTTLCDNTGARWFNRGTYGLYCAYCARGQNGNDVVPISVPVEAKPTLAEMAEMRAEMSRQDAEHRARMAR